MKKKEVRKLSLNRETLQALNESRLEEAVGGGVTVQFSNCHCTFQCTGACY